MKCANPACGHEKHEGPCRVIIHPASSLDKNRLCGCYEFVEPPDQPVCPGCGEVVSYSHSFALLNEKLPYLFVCVWCTNCKHILTSQVTVALQPLPPAKNPGASNIHVPGGPL